MLAGRSAPKKKKIAVTSPKEESDSDGHYIPCDSFSDGIPVVPRQEVMHVVVSASEETPLYHSRSLWRDFGRRGAVIEKETAVDNGLGDSN